MDVQKADGSREQAERYVGKSDEQPLLGAMGNAFSVTAHKGQQYKPISPWRILLVESNTGVRTLFSFFLEKLRCQVVAVRNGFAAIEQLLNNAEDAAKTNFDLILLDWHLCDLSGAKTYRYVRNLSKNHKVPLIALVDEEESNFSQSAREMGVNAVLGKYAHPHYVRCVIRQFLKKPKKPSSSLKKGGKKC